MPKFIKLSEELLKGQSLSVVREIGRQMGVQSPSSLSIPGLISKILKIQSGELAPVKQVKRGAPSKPVDVSAFYERAETDNMPATDLQKKLPECSYDNIKTVPENSEIIMRDDSENLITGVLEQHVSGYGFLRVNNYENSDGDVYVSQQNIKKYNLRRGDKVTCKARPTQANAAALTEVVSINDLSPEVFLKRKNFDDLVPYYPTDRIRLETEPGILSTRCADLFAPLGMGQRGLIVAPPKAGKTTFLKAMASAIEKNYPEIKLIILLIDERPEEVTDMKRSVKGEVVYSTFDENPEHHIRAAELVINRAKRLVEVGKNVVVLMDSITKLTRAYNNLVESSGKTLSGGIDPAALYAPKKFFGAARNIEGGGSLTLISTALVDTGSRMDDVIYEEFKGTGNMEIHLSRDLAEKRIFPAIDIVKSGTRRDDLLLTDKERTAVYKLRKLFGESEDATENFLTMLSKTKTNEEFVNKVDSWIELYKNN